MEGTSRPPAVAVPPLVGPLGVPISKYDAALAGTTADSRWVKYLAQVENSRWSKDHKQVEKNLSPRSMKRVPLHPERWIQAPRAIALVQLKVKKGPKPDSEPVGTFGLRWREESAKPEHGRELKNKKLSDALSTMNVNAEEFTQSELEGFLKEFTQSERDSFFGFPNGTRRPSSPHGRRVHVRPLLPVPALPLTDQIAPNVYVRAMSSTTGLPRYYTPMGYKQGAIPAGTVVYVLQSMSLADPGTVRAQVADSPMAGAPPLGWVTAMKQGKVNLDFIVSETAHETSNVHANLATGEDAALTNHLLIGMRQTVEGGGGSGTTFYSSWPPQDLRNERTLGAGGASPRSSRAGSPARTPGVTPRDIESARMWESLGSARQEEVVDIAELLGSARGGPNSARGLSISSPTTSPKRPRRGFSERSPPKPGSPGSMASRIAAQRRERSEIRSPNAKKKKARLAAPSFMWRKLMQHAVRRDAALQRIDHEFKDISEKFGMLLLRGEKDVFGVRDSKGEIDVKKLIEAWDEDGDGDISRMEFRIAAYKLGFGTDDVRRLDGLYDCLDLDGDEQLQMHEVSGALEKWKQVTGTSVLQSAVRGRDIRQALAKWKQVAARGRDADLPDVQS